MKYKTLKTLLHCSIIQFVVTHAFAVIVNGQIHKCKSQTSAIELALQVG